MSAAAPLAPTALTDPSLRTRHSSQVAAPLGRLAPDIRGGEAHADRAVVRGGSDGSADAAGGYEFARIGCGAHTPCPAPIGGRSGPATVPRTARRVSARAVEIDPAVDTLTLCRDSRLPAAIGAPDEHGARHAASHHDWRDRGPVKVGLPPLAGFCAGRRTM